MEQVGFKFDEKLEGHYSPVQPEETEEIMLLRDAVKDVATEDFETKYGGKNRAYERFLYARGHNLKKAEKMLRDTLRFRQKYRLDEVRSDEEIKSREELFTQIKPFWTLTQWGFTKDHQLVIYGALKNIKPGEFLRTFTEEQVTEFYLNFMEQVLQYQNYANSSPRREETDDKWRGNVEIYDFKGVNRHQLAMHGLLVLKRVLALGQGNYPENLDRTFLINVPWYFSAVWKVISIVLNKRTLEKVVISSGDSRKKITEMMGSEDVVNELFSTKF